MGVPPENGLTNLRHHPFGQEELAKLWDVRRAVGPGEVEDAVEITGRRHGKQLVIDLAQPLQFLVGRDTRNGEITVLRIERDFALADICLERNGWEWSKLHVLSLNLIML